MQSIYECSLTMFSIWFCQLHCLCLFLLSWFVISHQDCSWRVFFAVILFFFYDDDGDDDDDI